MLLRLLTVFVLLFTSMDAPASANAADETGAHWTMTRLDVDVYPDFVQHGLRVTGEARLRLEGVDSSFGPTLRLGHDLTPYNDNPDFMTYAALRASGQPVVTLNRPGSTRGIQLADIRYAQPKRRGEQITVHFEVRMTHPSFTAVIADRVAVASAGTGWYPTPVPPPGADAMREGSDATDDPSRGVTRVHLPRGYSSFSTGVLSARREGRETIEIWRKDGPRTRGFVAGDYQRATRRVAGVDVYSYSLTPDMDADLLSEQVGSVITTLSRHFGPFPYRQYAAAEILDDAVPWWGLADGEYQVLRTSLVKVGGVNGLAHEIGHAWWGNLIEPDWPGGYMLSEALADYSGMLAMGELMGPTYFDEAIALRAPIPGAPPDYTMQHHFEYVAQGQAAPLSQLEPGGVGYELALVKGSRVFHMLRMRVGDDVFFSVLRQLLRDHAHATLSLPQLREAFIEAAPGADLMQFFEQWLDRIGAPVFDAHLSCLEDPRGGKINRVTLTQTQAGEPYILDLDIQLTGAAQAAAFARVRGRETVVDAPAAVCLTQLELNPARNLFIWREEYGNRPS